MTAPNVFDPQCGSRLVLERLSDKWTALLVYALLPGPERFNALQRKVGGISQKVLSQSLRSLESDGLVVRTVTPSVPPQVEYALSPLGLTLAEPLAAICRWSEAHLGELQAARARDEQMNPGRSS